jgi:O-antigen/teichoic acid export membrane protein
MLGRKIGHGTLSLFIAESTALPAGLAIATLLSRMLGPAGYGRYGVAAAIVVAVEWLIVAGYGRISIQLLSDPEHSHRLTPPILRLYLGTALLAMAALWASAGVLAALLDAPHLIADLRLLAIDVPLFALAHAQRSVLTARGKYFSRATAIAVRWITRVAATWAFVALGWGVSGAIWAWPVASLAELVSLRQLPVAAFLRSGGRISEIWREGWSPFLFSLGQRSLERMDLLFLQAVGAAPATVGIYVAAQNLAIVPGLLGASLSPVLISAITEERLLGREPASRQTSADALRVIMYLFPLAAVFWTCGEDLITFIFGEPFRDGGRLLAWLIAGAIGLVLSSASVSIISAQGRHRLIAWFSLPNAVCAVLLYFLVVPRYGALGAAMVAAVVGVTSGLCATAAVFRGWHQPFPIATLLRVATASLAVVLVSQWSTFLWLAWPVRICILVLAAGLLLWLLGEWNLRQLRDIVTASFRT